MGSDILGGVTSAARAAVKGNNAFIVTDSHFTYEADPEHNAGKWLSQVKDALEDAGFTVHIRDFKAGEAAKNLRTLADILEAMASVPLNRDDIVIALGGGVTGDIAGFAAACYMRGIQVIQVPTSLLAMVDSSVGGKTAVDLPSGKNLAGAFWQPSAVIASIDCLSTISPGLLTDSCGEVIKHAVLADRQLFEELEKLPINTRNAAGELDYERLERVIARNVEIKRDVVNADEKEQGLRQTLNLGHTIGHAIESANGYNLGHGASVAAGLCFIVRYCAKKGICTQECADRIVSCVAAHGLPTTTDTDIDTLYAYALSDKKRHGATVNTVLVEDIGQVRIQKMSLEEFKEVIELGR